MKNRLHFFLPVILVSALLLLLAGCAKPAMKPAATAAGPSMAGYAPEPREFAKPPAHERPGLATGWGENRQSSVTMTQFSRRSKSSPDGLGCIYYNDQPGIQTMLASLNVKPMSCFAGLQPMGNNSLSVALQGEDGHWLPAWNALGTYYVIGEKGQRYAIVVRNDTMGRLEIVLSVDGLDVLDGKTASYRKRGYILDPGQTYAIEGFRTGLNSVAAFRFSDVAQSYAAQKHDTTRNVGVIGVAVFKEKIKEVEKRKKAEPFPGTWATPPGD